MLIHVFDKPFLSARELSPCIVLLDNLDMLLGASSAENDTAPSSDEKTSTHLPGSSTGGGRSRGVRSTRTRHQAVDRMLSTLLVEVDGVYTTSSSAGTAAQVRCYIQCCMCGEFNVPAMM
jgi:SpoVK/Ycf46/Vps4 family AAA+-type ATPase